MIVLDTHAWVWWIADPGKLSAQARRALREAITGNGDFNSSMSAWEVAMLDAKDRLELTVDAQDWITTTEALPLVNFVPVDNTIANHSTDDSFPLARTR